MARTEGGIYLSGQEEPSIYQSKSCPRNLFCSPLDPEINVNIPRQRILNIFFIIFAIYTAYTYNTIFQLRFQKKPWSSPSRYKFFDTLFLFSIPVEITHYVNRSSPLTQFEVLKGGCSSSSSSSGSIRFWRAPRVQPERQSDLLRRLFALHDQQQEEPTCPSNGTPKTGGLT